MKKTSIIAFAILCIFTACKKGETVEVEKIVQKTIKPTDAIDSVRSYLLTTKDSYQINLNVTPAFLTSNLKTLINSNDGVGLDYFTIYGGKNRFEGKNTGRNGETYGNDRFIIVLCWYNTRIKQARVFGFSAQNEFEYYSSQTYQTGSTFGDDLKAAEDFAKNTYLGTITRAEVLARK